MFVRSSSIARATSLMLGQYRLKSSSIAWRSYRAIARSSRTAADPTASSLTRRRSFYKRMVSRCAGSRRAFRNGAPLVYRSQQAEGEHMAQTLETPAVDLEVLRQAIRDEYAVVADDPEHG